MIPIPDFPPAAVPAGVVPQQSAKVSAPDPAERVDPTAAVPAPASPAIHNLRRTHHHHRHHHYPAQSRARHPEAGHVSLEEAASKAADLLLGKFADRVPSFLAEDGVGEIVKLRAGSAG